MARIKKKQCLFVAIILLLCLVNTFSQSSDKIVLTGTFISVEPETDRRVCGEKSDNCFRLNLLLQFRNNSAKPAIILNSIGFCRKKISFFNGVSNNATDSASIEVQPNGSMARDARDREAWDDYYARSLTGFISSILRPNSSPVRSVIIPAEGYHEYRESLIISEGYKLQKELDPKKKGKYILSVLPKYPALKIEYFLSLRNRPEDPNALEKAKENWKEFGDLLLDSNGDYRIESEIILNKLP